MALGLDDPSPNAFPFSAAELLRQFEERPDPHELDLLESEAPTR